MRAPAAQLRVKREQGMQQRSEGKALFIRKTGFLLLVTSAFMIAATKKLYTIALAIGLASKP